MRQSPVLVRTFAFLIIIFLAAFPAVGPIYWLEYEATQGKSVIWAPICLFGVFTVGLPHWMRWVHHLKRPWQRLGVAEDLNWWRHWLLAFLVGTIGVTILYGLQVAVGWGIWIPPNGRDLVLHALEGLGVGVGVGVAEELLFRGWLLFELEQSFSFPTALWLNAGIFAIAHYTRPLSVILATWPQFFGLLLLGATLVWARRIPVRTTQARTIGNTLWLAAGLHSGLVFAYYQVDVGDLVVASGEVPEWITGVDNNPLAGLLGLLLLGAIGTAAFAASHVPKR